MRQRLKQFIKNILISLDKLSPRPVSCSFIMTPSEKKAFERRIKHSKNYLEFGMGGSTIHVLKNSKANVFSVDSSMEWLELMRSYWLIKFMERKRLTLFYVNIGPTREWGHPIDTSHQKLFPNYSSSILNEIPTHTLDTVLVDGRFRVACVLQTILKCHESENFQLLIHDFWNREQYHAVLNYLDEIERAESLGVFKIKRDINLEDVQREYDRFKFNQA